MSRPFMPFYSGDWMRDTAHLDDSQERAYFRLVLFYWDRGALPDDDKQLARIVHFTPKKWEKTRPILQTFFDLPGDGLWHHKRIDKELKKSEKFIEKQRANGAKPKAKHKPDANQNETRACVSQPQPQESSIEDSLTTPPADRSGSAKIEAGFAEFYAAYPKRTNRKTALARYATAIKAGVTHERIMEGTRRYAEAVRAARTEPQFIKAPDAWLNAGKYDDEHLPQRPRSANGWAALAAEMMEENRDGKRHAIEEIRAGETVLELPRRVEDGSGKRDDERGELPRNPATALIRDAVRRM